MRYSSIAFIVLALASQVASAQSVQLNPVADAFVTTGSLSDLVNDNYGGGGAISIAPANLSKGAAHSYMRFDLASAKTSFDAQFGAGNWFVQSATLRMNSISPNNFIFNGNAAGPGGSNVNFAGQFRINWMEDDTWIEGGGSPTSPGSTGITWNSQPSSAADQPMGSFAFPGGISGANTYALDLAEGFYADALAGGLTSLRFVPDDQSIAYTFGSRTNASRPVLTINAAIPEPAALNWLAMLPILALRRPTR